MYVKLTFKLCYSVLRRSPRHGVSFRCIFKAYRVTMVTAVFYGMREEEETEKREGEGACVSFIKVKDNGRIVHT